MSFSGRISKQLQKLAGTYGMDVSTLMTEYSLFKKHRRDCLEKCKTILDVLQITHKTGLHRVYGELHTLYHLFVTLPVTTASCERSFSKLTIVKSSLRSTMAQGRLENLMILFIENDITSELHYETIIDSFVVVFNCNSAYVIGNEINHLYQLFVESISRAVASGPSGPVLAGPLFFN